MSLKTWKDKFYPLEAEDATASAIMAAHHSLQKWSGARPWDLLEHDIVLEGCGILIDRISRQQFHLDSSTCALCHLSRDINGNLECQTCPGTIANGHQCHAFRESPYAKFNRGGNPTPMIEWLERTVKHLQDGVDHGSTGQ